MKTTTKRALSFRFLASAAAVSMALSASAVQAEELKPNTDEVYKLDPVVVTATRLGQSLSQTAASIAVVTDKTIEEQGYSTLGETLQNLPNVMVTDADSPLSTRVSIRGSNALEITYLVDGVRQDNTSLSGMSPIGAFIDPELIRQVEVKNGGGSALYGNGGIGGTIAVTTKMATDFLEPGEKFGVLAKTGYSSTLHEWSKSGYAFGRWDALDVLFAVTRRDSGDIKLSSGSRPDYDTDTGYTSLMLKTSLIPNDSTLLSLTYNLDDYGTSSVTGAERDPMKYKYRQHRVTGSWEYENGGFFNLKTNLQFVKNDFSLDQYLSNLGGGQGNSDGFKSWSGNIQNTNRFGLLGEHTLTYGADFSRTKQHSLTYNPFVTEAVPDNTRPNSKAIDTGFFIEDEYSIGKYLTVSPSLRWSYFKREADKAEYKDFSDSKVTPGVTLTLKPLDGLSFWVSAVEGFRPPVLDELYYSQNALPWFPDAVVEANPNLKPEKSWNYEIGMNAKFAGLLSEKDTLSVKAAAFYDDVKDFINVDYYDDDNWVTHYQTVNYGHVVKKGLELTGTYAVGNFDVTASYGLVHATDKETDTRVAGITPQSLNLRLGYTFPSLALNAWYRASWNDAASGDKAKNTASTRVKFDSFTTHAVGFTWAPRIKNFWDFTAGVAVENLTNEKYRYVNGSYGHGRGVRVWVSGKF